MKVHYKTRDNRLVFEVQAETAKELFKGIASIQDIFEAERECGCCHSPNLRYSVRTIEENDYYELICTECNARFQFGQHKKGGTLFPKRTEGGGWKRWSPDRAIDAPATPTWERGRQ